MRIWEMEIQCPPETWLSAQFLLSTYREGGIAVEPSVIANCYEKMDVTLPLYQVKIFIILSDFIKQTKKLKLQ